PAGLGKQDRRRERQKERDGARVHQGLPGVSGSPGARARNRYECAVCTSRDSVYFARDAGSMVCTTSTFAIIGTDGRSSWKCVVVSMYITAGTSVARRDRCMTLRVIWNVSALM